MWKMKLPLSYRSSWYVEKLNSTIVNIKYTEQFYFLNSSCFRNEEKREFKNKKLYAILVSIFMRICMHENKTREGATKDVITR